MKINRLVIFGDSLLDTGNIIKTLDIPGKPYFDGRFTNGLVSTEYLAEMITKYQSSAEVKHISYAMGGALTHGSNPFSLIRDHAFPVSSQLLRFENEEGTFSDSDMVIINGGANNFMFTFYKEVPYINLIAKLRVARDLKKILLKSITMGANNIIVWNIPDVTRALVYKDYLSNWIGKFFKIYLQSNIKLQNGLLRNKIDSLKMLFPNVKIRIFDFNWFLNDCFENHLQYGFENVDKPCIDSYGGVDFGGNIQKDMKLIGDPDKHLCWDYCHPTAKANKMMAEKIFELWKEDI